MVATLYIDFSDAQWQLNLQSVVFELIQAYEIMVVLVTCKNEEDPFKMKVLEWSHYKSMRIFPDAQRQLTSQYVDRSGRKGLIWKVQVWKC